MPSFHIHDEKLTCPYKGCGKSFDKPTILTDSSTLPRQTYYACPYCMSKIDIILDEMKVIGIKPTEYPKVLETPAKCANYMGFLNALPKEAPIPDECLICPKVLQCSIKRQ